MTPETIAAAALLTAGAACVIDLRTRRIPNWLTFGSAGAACLSHLLEGGLSGLGTAAGGWCLGLLLFLPMFLLRGMGAGDVKLLAALGAWLGPWTVLPLALWISTAGALLAVVVALHHGYTRTAAANLWVLFLFWRVGGVRAMPALTLEGSNGPRLAYAVPMLAGLVAVLLWR